MKQKTERPWLIKFKKDFKNKKVLVMGLGLLGRGLADAGFLSQIGAQVKVTDLKTPKELKASLRKLRKLPIKFTLGRHKKEDVVSSDFILRNPAVPLNFPI